MCFPLLSPSKPLSKITSKEKSLDYTLMVGENSSNSNIFSHPMASPIFLHHLTLRNTMGSPNGDIVILLKLVSPFFIKLLYLSPIGLTPLKQLPILSTACPLRFYTISPHSLNYLMNNPITLVFVPLGACVFLGYVLTIQINYFLVPAHVSSLVTHLIKVPFSVLIFPPTNFLSLGMFNLMSPLFLLPTSLPPFPCHY
ncbi:unnamed protein product [Prunus brigantina]